MFKFRPSRELSSFVGWCRINDGVVYGWWSTTGFSKNGVPERWPHCQTTRPKSPKQTCGVTRRRGRKRGKCLKAQVTFFVHPNVEKSGQEPKSGSSMGCLGNFHWLRR